MTHTHASWQHSIEALKVERMGRVRGGVRGNQIMYENRGTANTVCVGL